MYWVSEPLGEKAAISNCHYDIRLFFFIQDNSIFFSQWNSYKFRTVMIYFFFFIGILHIECMPFIWYEYHQHRTTVSKNEGFYSDWWVIFLTVTRVTEFTRFATCNSILALLTSNASRIATLYTVPSWLVRIYYKHIIFLSILLNCGQNDMCVAWVLGLTIRPLSKECV